MKLEAWQRNTLEKIGIPLLIALVLVGLTAYYFSGEISRLQELRQQDLAAHQQALAALEKAGNEKLETLRTSSEAKAEELASANSALAAQLDLTQQQTNAAFDRVSQTLNAMETQKNTELSALKQQITGLSVESGDFSGIIDELIPKVASIKTQGGMGSGAIIREDGLIVTNYHVIEGKAEVNAALSNRKTYKAEIIGFNQDNDIAVLKIDRTGLRFFEFGNSDNLRVGEKVLALGNPLGLDFTVTQGIVSAKNRKISGMAGDFIQTDVPINPGNSGGPLVNKAGELVGLNTMKAKNQEGLGFAIPSNFVKSNAEEIIAKWEAKKAQG